MGVRPARLGVQCNTDHVGLYLIQKLYDRPYVAVDGGLLGKQVPCVEAQA